MIRKAGPEDMKFLVRGMWDLIEELRELTDDPYFSELTKSDRYMFRTFFEEWLADNDVDILSASGLTKFSPRRKKRVWER